MVAQARKPIPPSAPPAPAEPRNSATAPSANPPSLRLAVHPTPGPPPSNEITDERRRYFARSSPGPVGEGIDGGGGRPLDPATRVPLERSFSFDFAGVRVHTGSRASESTKALHALAYTTGRDIAFREGSFAPGTPDGRRLLAHELAHVVQQGAHGGARPGEITIGEPSSPAERAAEQAADAVARGGSAPPLAASVAPAATVHRAPSNASSTEALHQDLIEQYRRDMGLPPGGIDASGQQVGPTDQEIRFGGLLEGWLAGRAAPPPRSVPAPAQAPTIVGAGNTNVVAGCQNAPDVGACREHRNYVTNILPQAIANIRAVRSPYSTAIADLYGSALPAAQAAAPPTPGGRSVDAAGGPVTVTFGATTHTFTRFTISLQQWAGGANGQAFGMGGPIAFVSLNESSADAMLRNLPGIEETMVHEAIHLLSSVVEAQNAARAPGTRVDTNLDPASYGSITTSFTTAVLPFVNQIRQLPSFSTRASPLTAQQDARGTADTFLSEVIARTEAAIYLKQRSGQGFSAGDLSGLSRFYRSSAYWSPKPPVITELDAFLVTNQPQIDAAVLPIVVQAGEQYLRRRP
jgi:hypothetical protein